MLKEKEKPVKSNCPDDLCDHIDFNIIFKWIKNKYSGVFNGSIAAIVAGIVGVGIVGSLVYSEPVQKMVDTHINELVSQKTKNFATKEDVKCLKEDINLRLSEQNISIRNIKNDIKKDMKSVDDKLDRLIMYQLERKN